MEDCASLGYDGREYLFRLGRVQLGLWLVQRIGAAFCLPILSFSLARHLPFTIPTGRLSLTPPQTAYFLHLPTAGCVCHLSSCPQLVNTFGITGCGLFECPDLSRNIGNAQGMRFVNVLASYYAVSILIEAATCKRTFELSNRTDIMSKCVQDNLPSMLKPKVKNIYFDRHAVHLRDP